MAMLKATLSMSFDPGAEKLLRVAILALHRAELKDSLDALYGRLVRSRRLMMLDKDEKGAMVARLSPYAELALLEAIEVARSNATAPSKTTRITQALTMAGY